MLLGKCSILMGHMTIFENICKFKKKLEIAWYISAIYKPVFVPLHKNYAFQK